MRQLFTWVLSAVFFAALGGLGTWFFLEGREEPEHEEKAEAATQSAPAELPPVGRDESGAVVVRLDEQTQKRLGLQLTPLPAAEAQPEVVAFGMVQEDPSRSFTVRAPFAGTIVATDAGKWVQVGQTLEVDASMAGIVPRLGPVEQADLKARLAGARADEQAAQASLEAHRISLESKRKLNTGQQKIVSDQVLQEAEAVVKGEEARLKAAQETVRLLEASTSGAAATRPGDIVPLKVGKRGQVIDVLAQPGEAVESGQALFRLADFERLFAKVALPAGRPVSSFVSATIAINGDVERACPAELVGPTALVDPVTGGQTLVLSFSPAEGPQTHASKSDKTAAVVQPGMPVTARLRIEGAAAKGVAIPRDAIVRYVGTAWVYVKSGDETFTRREVLSTQSTPEGWFVSAGFAPGEPVVSRPAQALLSQELKFQTAGGEEEEE
jgi:biotin carboxyl carrier protein